MDGSVFDAELPVIWCQLTLPKLVSLDIIEQFLTNPEKRLTWDKDSVVELRNISYDDLEDTTVYYQITKFPWPMQNRDFIEIKKRIADPHDLRIVYHATDGIEPVEGIVRGETIFGVQRFMHEKDVTKIYLMTQTNTGLNLGTNQKAFCMLLKSWVSKFSKVILKESG